MSFFFRPAFYPERPAYTSRQPVSDDEAYYRRVAEEHQRRAQAALALAQEEERRRRQYAAQRLFHDEPHFRPESRQDYGPFRPHYSRGPFDFPGDHHDSQFPPRYEHLPDVSPAPRSREQISRDDHEHQIEEWLQRRRQRELEEAEFRRLKELERRRDDELMREMLAAFGVDSLQRTRPTPATTSSPRFVRQALREEAEATSDPRQGATPTQACTCGRHVPTSQSSQLSEPAFAQPSSPSADFATQLWNALSGGRSDEERTSILRELGVPVPVNVSRVSNARNPATEQRSVPAQRNTAAPTSAPKPQTQTPRPASIPVIVRSPTPATPQPPKLSTSRTSSPPPVKQSPFAHIESIQTKFDALRNSIPDLSNQQKKREYLAELNQLLTSLDSVESSGSESIRGARKALVRAVEEELEKVEGHQEEEKEDVVEETEQGEAKVADDKAEQKTVHVEAAHESQASAQHVSDEVEIQSVSESAAPVHPAEPTVEEPANEFIVTPAQPQATEAESSSEPVQDKVNVHPEAPVSPSEELTSGDDVNGDANVDDQKVDRVTEEPQRGRQSTVAHESAKPSASRARRPPSVEIEEVPDEESLSGSPRVGNQDL